MEREKETVRPDAPLKRCMHRLELASPHRNSVAGAEHKVREEDGV